MNDLKSPGIIKLKAALFLVVGIITATMLIRLLPSLQTAFLLALCVWSFCRVYYFAFYVIEHYVDPTYRFSGLWSFVCYFLFHRKK